jgi:hypothetical protein
MFPCGCALLYVQSLRFMPRKNINICITGSRPGPRRNSWNPLPGLSTVVPYSLRCPQHTVSLFVLTGKHFQTAIFLSGQNCCRVNETFSNEFALSEWLAMFGNFVGQYIASSRNSVVFWVPVCEKSLLLLQLRKQTLSMHLPLCSENVFLYFSACFVWKCQDKL